MPKIIIYDDNGDVIISKTLDGDIKKVFLETTEKEFEFYANEKDVKINKLKEMLDDDKFWED